MGHTQRNYMQGNNYFPQARQNRPAYNNGYPAAPAPRQFRKHSGAKIVHDKKKPERPCLTAWNYSKRLGLVTLIACQASTDFKVKKPEHAHSIKWHVKITIPMQGDKTYVGSWHTEKQKLYIPELGLVVNPSAPNGGYFGRCQKPKNRY